MKSILLIKKVLGTTPVVKMTFGLVNASFSLPKWQGVTKGLHCICSHMASSGTLIPFLTQALKTDIFLLHL